MKKKGIIAAAGLAAVALVGGTFAYFTQTTTIDNPFNTGVYKTVVTEDFNPEDGDNWKPGAEVNKDVYVQNTGDQPVVVRVKFEERWSRKDETTGDDKVFKDNDVDDTYVLYQDSETDGKVEADQSVVEKKYNLVGSRDKDGNVWSDKQSDGWYYYYTLLEPEQITPKLLDSVTLSKDVDLGDYYSTVYYTLGPKGDPAPQFDEKTWKWAGSYRGKVSVVSADMMKAIKDMAGDISEEQTLFTTVIVEPDPDAMGYSDADYVLSITIETVQATDQAVLDTFFGGEMPTNDELKEIYDNWKLEPEKLPEITEAEPTEGTSSESETKG